MNDARPRWRARRARITGVLAASVALAAAGAAVLPALAASAGPTLAQVATARGFHVGTAAEVNSLASSQWRYVADSQFNSVTMGNEGKWDATEPAQGQFDFAAADAIADYTAATGKRLRGHTLVWHNQLPAWVSAERTAAEQRQVLIDHVTGVAGHFAGDVAQWDVVNEPFNEDGTLRSSVWYTRLGEDYIADALTAARAADPAAKLFVNDYNVEGVNAKSTGLYDLVRRLQARGVPIDGVGLQAHLIVGQVPSSLRQNIERFTALGLSVEITELDVRIPLPADAAELTQQAADYRAVVGACAAVAGCTGVTTWGVGEVDSWIPEFFPGYGAALLFDEQWQARPAYSAVVEALGGTATVPAPPPVPSRATVAAYPFETGLDGWGSRGGETTAHVTTVAHAGTGSVLSSGRTATWQGPTRPVLDLLTPGKLYTVTGWARTASGSGTARLSMQRQNGTATRYENISATTAIGTTWTRLSGDYLFLPGATALSLYLETTDTTGDLYLDDVTIETEGPPVSQSPSASVSASVSASASASVSPSASRSPSVSPSPSGGSGTACAVRYTTDDWGSGFVGTVTVTNTGPSAVNGWTLRWTFAGDQRVSQAWGATLTQSGAAVSAANATWNGTVAAGASVTLGFLAGYTGTNARPAAFTLNGTTCALT
ncbi:endo-1,4-beta-xylanase [Dactylosporangium aurantiacum]|uniref:Beta-xylanase n=1 Tax=Dactylosporangium aurantiacum TaxID=35754 RepID=A0A9Q9MHI5_9ACTN|nr:endo-1,4-beta-xylanase [Dactylosporangium aurantiacum]MDG6101491.1 endo-1,4-beta-xylanase [Dactylosporangium aurantiacum]UWZ52661.1 endo-1,4-beta-xylanase [Dactylosporangium aurantiacum]